MTKARRTSVLLALIVIAGTVGGVGWTVFRNHDGRAWSSVEVRDVGLSADRRTVYAAAKDDLHCGEVRVRIEPKGRRWAVVLEARDRPGGFCKTYGCITGDITATPNTAPDMTDRGDAGCGPYATRLARAVPEDVSLVTA